MDADQMQAVRELVEFARKAVGAPADVLEAAEIAETYLDGDQNEVVDETLPE